MSKDDVEIPRVVPRKRRELQRALDKWLAVWASDDSLPPPQRARAQGERDRRKASPEDVAVGVIVGEEGMTPVQADTIVGLVSAAAPTELHVIRPRHLRRVFAAVASPVVTHGDEQELVRACGLVVAAPKEPEKPDRVEGVWEAVRYAKHRKVAVRVVLPNGDER